MFLACSQYFGKFQAERSYVKGSYKKRVYSISTSAILVEPRANKRQ